MCAGVCRFLTISADLSDSTQSENFVKTPIYIIVFSSYFNVAVSVSVVAIAMATSHMTIVNAFKFKVIVLYMFLRF